jgi:hypothetical protein
VDDILLSTSTVSRLKLLLQVCDEELAYLDTMNNLRKSLRTKFGHRYDANCAELRNCSQLKVDHCNVLLHLKM